MTMKLYKLNDYDWFIGASLGHALYCYQKQTGISDEELVDEFRPPREVTGEEMRSLVFIDDDGSNRSFAEQFEREKRRGMYGEGRLFASTEQ